MAEYDAFEEIYDHWTATAPAASPSLVHYVEAYCRTAGLVVELGVGNGRIALEAAARGKHVLGIDISPKMLARCRERAEQRGIGDCLSLMEADFRSFQANAPAETIALPYHSIGHLLTLDDKREALRHVHASLAPGGRFLFDDMVVRDEDIARMRQVQLRAELPPSDGDAGGLLWVTSLIDSAQQRIRVVTWVDRIDSDGGLTARRYRRFTTSWLEPAQARTLLEESGFAVESVSGGFAGEAFDPDRSTEQVWVARRPP